MLWLGLAHVSYGWLKTTLQVHPSIRHWGCASPFQLPFLLLYQGGLPLPSKLLAPQRLSPSCASRCVPQGWLIIGVAISASLLFSILHFVSHISSPKSSLYSLLGPSLRLFVLLAYSVRNSFLHSCQNSSSTSSLATTTRKH